MEWIRVDDRLPDGMDVKDKKIKISDGSENVAYLSPEKGEGRKWCDWLAVPIIKTWEGDERTVTHWTDID